MSNFLRGKLKRWQAIILIAICINIFLSAWWLLNGDIHYDLDISRDFLLLKDIIDTKKLTLIGPHTGIFGGVFHGPLWYYINLPAFILSGGDPLLMGWFWWGLSILTLIIFFIIVKKLFNETTAYLATLLYSVNSIINPSIGLKQFYNPYGAVVISPVFFYFFIKYIETLKVLYLILLLFFLGLLIQFQMAFGIPILILTFLYLVYFIFKNKKLSHFLYFPTLILPLSTFILFDLKHSFLQTKSFISFATEIVTSHQSTGKNLSQFIYEKIFSLTIDTFFLLTQDNRVLAAILFLFFIYFSFKIRGKYKDIYRLFMYFYFGYWIIYLPFNISWTTYYWPFLPIIIILFCGFLNCISKKVFILIFSFLILWNYFISFYYISIFNSDIYKRGVNSWAFNKLVAESIYKDADENFGYYIYTPYIRSENQMYALSFAQHEFPNIKSFPFKKQNLTYLILVDVNSGLFKTDSNGWKITHIKIQKEPISTKQIDVVDIQKFTLSDQETKIPSNPYLFNSTFFR